MPCKPPKYFVDGKGDRAITINHSFEACEWTSQGWIGKHSPVCQCQGGQRGDGTNPCRSAQLGRRHTAGGAQFRIPKIFPPSQALLVKCGWCLGIICAYRRIFYLLLASMTKEGSPNYLLACPFSARVWSSAWATSSSRRLKSKKSHPCSPPTLC